VGDNTAGIGVVGSSNNIGVQGQSTGGTGVSGKSSGTNGIGVYGQNTTATGVAGYFDGNVNVTSSFSYYWNGTTCVYGACTPSDRRLKKNIKPLPGALDTLLQIIGVTYEWKTPDEHHPAGTQTGVIAQDVEKVFPQWVSETPEGVKVINIDQRTLLGIVVESFRTLKTENDDLKARVSVLENGGHPPAAGLTRFLPNGAGWGLSGILFGFMMASKRKKQA
jgi:hypothetical protein